MSSKLYCSDMNANQIEVLKKSDWFRNVPENILIQILNSATEYTLDQGKHLITIGEMGNSMFLILEGKVKIVIPDSNNDEIIVNQLGPGELVGEMSLIDQKPRSASVIALTELSALEFSRERFMKILKQHPEISIHMITAMSNRMRFTLKYLENAVIWSKKISEGDFSFLDQVDTSVQEIDLLDKGSEEERTNSFLLSFLKMAKTLHIREQDLQDQLLKLTIQINQAKRDKELQNITSTDFFENLTENIQRIKNNRSNH